MVENKMTAEEYLQLGEDEYVYCELVDGHIDAQPNPNFTHQKTGGNLLFLSKQLLMEDKEIIYSLDVVLDRYNVYRPDVAIYCKGKEEVPEIVFEILSVSTKQKDLMVKPARYKAAGVKEYWIIDPESHTVIVHTFSFDEIDEINIYNANATIQSKVLPEFVVKASELFDEIA